MMSAELRATLIGIGTMGAMMLLVLLGERNLILHEAVPILGALTAAAAMVVLVRLGRSAAVDAVTPDYPQYRSAAGGRWLSIAQRPTHDAIQDHRAEPLCVNRDQGSPYAADAVTIWCTRHGHHEFVDPTDRRT